MGNYYQPTPKKWRQIGDAILFGTAALSTLMMGAPFDDRTISITIWVLSVVGVIGKVITNFFKSEEQ
jgi:hypothetical protein